MNRALLTAAAALPLILAANVAMAQSHAGHAGHAAPAAPAPQAQPKEQKPAVDPHAGHDMSSHAGHTAAPAKADPHAGHDMSGHAGHSAVPAQSDPHAGHDMSAMRGGPNILTSVDSKNGRLVEATPPAGAFANPAHAADLLFDPALMAASRQLLLLENGGMGSTSLFIDKLEAGFGDAPNSYGWSAFGWTGGDINRFWWKTEGGGR